MVDVNRESPLFDRLLPLQIQHVGDVSPLLLSDSSRQTSLVFRVLQGVQPTTVVGQNETVYHFEVTDERDSYFIFYFDVGEQSFPQFKREHSILVDFHVFPHMLIELLELCLRSHSGGSSEKDKEKEKDDESVEQDAQSLSLASTALHALHHSTYTAKLDLHSGVFSIIEANKFKQLTHISLPFRRGDDAAIKLYLSSRLALTLDVARRQSREIDSLTHKLQSENEMHEQLAKELHQLRTQKNVDMQSIQAAHSQELSTLQRSAMEASEAQRVKYEAQLDQLRVLLESTQQTLHERSLSLEQQVADLHHEKGQLEFKLRDLSRQLQSTEQDRERLLRECEEYHTQRREIDDEKSTLQRELLKLESRVEALQQQLSDREENMHKTLALQKAGEETKRVLEDQLALYLRQTQELQGEVSLTHDEIDKLTMVINRLHGENKTLKDKLKLKNEVIRRQEALINELRGKHVDVEQQLVSEKDKHGSANHQIAMLQTRLQEANEKAEETKKLLEEQKQVVAYLSEEVNRFQLGERLNAEPVFPKSSFLPPSLQSHAKLATPATPLPAYSASRPFSSATSSRPTPPTDHWAKQSYAYSSPEMKTSAAHTVSAARGTTSSSSAVANVNYLVQDAATKCSGGAAARTDTLLMKGIQTLGLSQEDALGVDVLQTLTHASSEPSSSDSAAYFHGNSTGGASAKKNTSVLSGNKNKAAVDLDELDYYALDRLPSASATNTAGIYKYSWQDPNFGKDE